MSDFEQAVSTLQREGQFFCPHAPIYVSRAPGRLDLMGGNVDYTGGLVFQATIREATWAAVQKRTDGCFMFWNPQMKQEGWLDRIEFDLSRLANEEDVRQQVNASPQVRWTAYVLGVFYFLALKFPEAVRTGANLYVESEVPLNKGVSSSAAVEVAVMKAAAAAYGLDLYGIELAEACQWVENVIAESACGIMDQAASVLGDEGYMLPLRCQSCLPAPLVKLPQGLRIWGIDSGVRHAVTGPEYEAARAAAFIGYAMICKRENMEMILDRSGRIPRFVEPRWHGYLSNISPSVFRSHYEDHLPQLAFGEQIQSRGGIHPDLFTRVRAESKYRVRACTRYAIEENQRIELFVEMARAAQPECPASTCCLLGDLMFQSHWSYSECGLGADATDLLVSLVRKECGPGKLYGAKITGGGGGGTVAVLGAEDAEESLERVVSQYAESYGSEPYVFDGSSMGADRFGVRLVGVTA
jgi:L-arabinokinase